MKKQVNNRKCSEEAKERRKITPHCEWSWRRLVWGDILLRLES
jgi:hypothetical protein